MPNHVTNILRVSGDPAQVKAMFEVIQSDEIGLGSIDFNKVLPMPPSLDMEYGSRAERGMKLYQDFSAESTALAMANVVKPDADHENRVAALVKKYEELTKDDPDLLKLGKQCCNNIKNYGHPSWYQWSVANWGTKWNSYGYDKLATPREFDGEHIEFQTAWTRAEPVISRLAKQYPDLTFEYLWADEDFGHNTGKKEFQNGEEIFSDIPRGGSKEALELAAEVHGMDLSEMGYQYNEKSGTYEYHSQSESMEMEL